MSVCVCVCVLTSQSVGIFRDCWQAWKCHSYILLQDRPSCVIHRISVVDTHTHTNTDSLTHTKSCMYRQMNARKNLHKAMQHSLTDASMLKSWLLTLTLWAYCVKARQQNQRTKYYLTLQIQFTALKIHPNLLQSILKALVHHVLA